MTHARVKEASGTFEFRCVVVEDVVRAGAGDGDFATPYGAPSEPNSYPRLLSCNTGGVTCAKIRCPPVDLLRSDSVAVVSLALHLYPFELGVDGDSDGDLEVAVRSEAHARFPHGLAIDPNLNERPDNAFAETALFVENVSIVFRV